MRGRWLVVALVISASLAVAVAVAFHLNRPKPKPLAATLSAGEFIAWINADRKRGMDLANLHGFLLGNKVNGVVPVWQLARGDAQRTAACEGAGFNVPPRAQWRNIVPALRIVRDEVIPAIGKVEAVSSWRSPALNRCAHGAKASHHLDFAAVDLVAVNPQDAKAMFTRLCAAWRKAGPKSGWGLGAYFDPARPGANRRARFHVDGAGWRTWGYSKSRASSGCNSLSDS